MSHLSYTNFPYLIFPILQSNCQFLPKNKHFNCLFGILLYLWINLRRIANLLTWGLLMHECSIVEKDNPPWALSIPTCSCWIYKKWKSLKILYLSCLRWTTLRDEETSPHRQRVSLDLLPTKVNSLFLSSNAVHYMYSNPPWVLYKYLVGLGGYWEQAQINMKLWLLLLL